MSGFFRCQVELERVTAQPEDVVVNTWHFDSDQTFAEDADDVAARLVTFYQAIDGFLQDLLTGNGTVKVYDLADPEPRVPGVILPFTFTPDPSSASMPAEVAVCLSMQGASGSGVNMRRRRGRIFLGPVGTAVRGAEVGGDIIVLESARTAILTAAVALATGPDPGDGQLAVFSPTHLAQNPGDLDGAFNDVTDLWIDDRFDTIRKRGSDSIARSTATV